MIAPGTDWEEDIDRHLASAQIILLLVSADFINSDYCYNNEMKRASSASRRGKSGSCRSCSARSRGGSNRRSATSASSPERQAGHQMEPPR